MQPQEWNSGREQDFQLSKGRDEKGEDEVIKKK